MIKISIIIPIYNSQKYLVECLRSIPRKDSNQFEVFLINDNSNDKSLEICKLYLKKFKNIYLINLKKNKGVSNARNLGLKLAVGKFICFLDSDDRYVKNEFNKLLNIINKNSIEDLFVIRSKLIKKNIIDKNQILRKASSGSIIKTIKNPNLFRATCWNFVVSKNLLDKNKIKFNKNIRVFEDQVFVSEILCVARDFKIISGALYERRLQEPNTLGKSTGYIVVIYCMKIILELGKILKNKNIINAKEKKRYLLSRIKFVEKQLLNNILICTNNQIGRVSYFFLQNISVFRNIRKLNNKTLRFISNSNLKIKKKLKEFKIKKKNKIKKLSKNKNCLIFCAGAYSEIVLKICNSLKIKVEYIIDNNKYYYNKKIHSKTIKDMPFLFKNLRKFLNYQILICNSKFSDFLAIKKQLLAIGFQRQDLKHINI